MIQMDRKKRHPEKSRGGLEHGHEHFLVGIGPGTLKAE
jgi:hypothetical protein